MKLCWQINFFCYKTRIFNVVLLTKRLLDYPHKFVPWRIFCAALNEFAKKGLPMRPAVDKDVNATYNFVYLRFENSREKGTR